MLISTGFSTTAAIISLYGHGNGGCRRGFVVAPVVLQPIAVVVCLLGCIIGTKNYLCGNRMYRVKQPVSKSGRFVAELPNRLELIAGVIQLLGNVVSLVMLALILATPDGCNNNTYNIVNSICGIAVSFVCAFLASFIEAALANHIIKGYESLRYRIEEVSDCTYQINSISSVDCIRCISKDRFKILPQSSEQCQTVSIPSNPKLAGLIRYIYVPDPFLDRPCGYQ